MNKKLLQLSKDVVLIFAAVVCRKVSAIASYFMQLLAFIGATAVMLFAWSHSQTAYTFTFAHHPFVFRVEPMDAVEQRVREADQAKEAEMLAKRK